MDASRPFPSRRPGATTLIDPFDRGGRSPLGAVVPRLARMAGVAPAPSPSTASASPLLSPSIFPDPAELPARALAVLAKSNGARQPPQSPRLRLQRRILSDGTECCLPIRYFDARCLIAAFPTDLERAADVLDGVGLAAVTDDDGRATVLFGCFEYRDSDLGPYNEVGLGILATAPKDQDSALYVIHLPVSTAATDRIGRELWGYRKFVAKIDVRGDDRAFSTTVREVATGTIAVLEGALRALAPSPPTDFPTYSLRNGKVLRTRIHVLTSFGTCGGSDFFLKLGASSHPMAQSLRALGLDGASPSAVRYADPFQALLFPGFEV